MYRLASVFPPFILTIPNEVQWPPVLAMTVSPGIRSKPSAFPFSMAGWLCPSMNRSIPCTRSQIRSDVIVADSRPMWPMATTLSTSIPRSSDTMRDAASTGR